MTQLSPHETVYDEQWYDVAEEHCFSICSNWEHDVKPSIHVPMRLGSKKVQNLVDIGPTSNFLQRNLPQAVGMDHDFKYVERCVVSWGMVGGVN